MSFLISTAAADSWVQPHPLEATSQNKHYRARTTSASTTQPAYLTVYAEDQTQLWQATLVNPISPTSLELSNDGNHVVTFDNWYSAGMGDSVMVFYHSGKLVRQYSLEQILDVEKIEPSHPAVSHTVSSRLWRGSAISFIEELDKASGRAGPNYVIWLAPTDQFLAWHMTTGEKLTAGDDQLHSWEDHGRAKAIKMLRPTENLDVAMQFLAKLRRPEDRKHIEKLLNSSDFNHGAAVSHFEKDQQILTELVSLSWSRHAADKALAIWDNQTWTEKGVLLGEVHGTLQLPVNPPAKKSFLHIYLIPETVSAKNWYTKKLTHHISRRLGSSRGNLIDNKIDFRFRHVTPGTYWIKAVYDFAPAYGQEDAIYPGEIGDYTTTDPTPLTVSPSQSAEAGAVECDHLLSDR